MEGVVCAPCFLLSRQLNLPPKSFCSAPEQASAVRLRAAYECCGGGREQRSPCVLTIAPEFRQNPDRTSGEFIRSPPGSLPLPSRRCRACRSSRSLHSAFSRRLEKDIGVRQPLQSFFAQMRYIVALRSQPLDDSHRHAHVGEEPHRFI